MTWPTGESLFACLHFAVPGGHTLITLNEWRKAGTREFLLCPLKEHRKKNGTHHGSFGNICCVECYFDNTLTIAYLGGEGKYFFGIVKNRGSKFLDIKLFIYVV